MDMIKNLVVFYPFKVNVKYYEAIGNTFCLKENMYSKRSNIIKPVYTYVMMTHWMVLWSREFKLAFHVSCKELM